MKFKLDYLCVTRQYDFRRNNNTPTEHSSLWKQQKKFFLTSKLSKWSGIHVSVAQKNKNDERTEQRIFKRTSRLMLIKNKSARH